jgi:hypothetical protein
MTWDEESAGNALGTRLKLIETPAHRVDLDQVVRQGRQTEQRWRLGAGAGALALVVAVAGGFVAVRETARPDRETGAVEVDVTPVRPADCTMTELPQEPVAGYLLSSDSTGRIVIGVSETGSTVVFTWRDGKRDTLAVPDAGQPWKVTAMNARGEMVGSVSSPATMQARPFLYRDGRLEWLPLPAGYTNGSATSINDNGDVGGWMSAPLTADPGERIVVWRADARDRPPVVLGPGEGAWLAAIGPDGTGVGSAQDGTGNSVAATWTPTGEQRLLPPPAGWAQARVHQVGRGFAYGEVDREPSRSGFPSGLPTVDPSDLGSTAPARWNLRTGRVEILRNLPGRLAAAAPSGWLAVVTGPRMARNQVVVVSPALQARALPVPSWADPDRPSVDARWISGDGRTITGTVSAAGGGNRPVLWRCR